MNVLSSGLPEVVADDETLARFLTSSSQFNSIMVKPAAFLPSPKSKNTSVFRHGRDETALRAIWNSHVAGERNYHGIAFLDASIVRKARLEITPEEPPPRHANIIGWEWLPQDPELQKARQKEAASFLAQHSTFVAIRM